jgi:hypothetical protein
VVLPEFVLSRWWEQLLHNQSALLLKGRLLFRRNTVVTSVPFHITDPLDEGTTVGFTERDRPATVAAASPSGEGDGKGNGKSNRRSEGRGAEEPARQP